MDLLDLIITIAILAAGSFLAGGKKKTQEKNGKPAAAPRMEPPISPASWQQFGTVDEVVNKGKAKSRKPSGQKYQTENPAYFSYENQPVDWEKTNAPVSNQEDEQAIERPSLAPIPFDLRQAFIYQTILQNDYIAEMK